MQKINSLQFVSGNVDGDVLSKQHRHPYTLGIDPWPFNTITAPEWSSGPCREWRRRPPGRQRQTRCSRMSTAPGQSWLGTAVLANIMIDLLTSCAGVWSVGDHTSKHVDQQQENCDQQGCPGRKGGVLFKYHINRPFSGPQESIFTLPRGVRCWR